MENNIENGIDEISNPNVDLGKANESDADNNQIEEVIELNDDEAFRYLKESRGLEFDSLDDFLSPKEKIVEKEIDSYEDLYDEDDKAYLKFKKETKGSRADYEKANANLDQIPKIELARERVRKESGSNFSDDQIDAYLADTLGIDLEDMSATDEINLAKFTKSTLEEKRADQEKYKKPIDKLSQEDEIEWVKLDNGSFIPQKDYEKLELEQSNSEKSRLAKIEIAKEAVNSVTTSNFEIEIGENGNVVKENYTYDYSEADKQSMLSNVSDLDGEITKDYTTDKGFDYKQFGEDMFWRNKNNREKAIASIIHKAIARNTEEVLKQRGNVNFTSNEDLQRQTKEGVKSVPITNIFNK